MHLNQTGVIEFGFMTSPIVVGGFEHVLGHGLVYIISTNKWGSYEQVIHINSGDDMTAPISQMMMYVPVYVYIYLYVCIYIYIYIYI